MEILQITAPQIRSSNPDGTLTLSGMAVPYGQSIEYMGYRESFASGAFDPETVTGTPLLWSHKRDEPVGHITAAENTDEGLMIEAIVQPTQRGRDAMTLLASGSLKGLSVGFNPTATKEDGNSLEYTSAELLELSLTPLPAYSGAAVTATRERSDTMPMTELREAEAIDFLAPITERLDQIEARMTAPAPQPARHLQVREALELQIADIAKSGRLRALTDVLSSGNAGVLPPQWSSEVRNAFDASRYVIPYLGKVAFPSSGHSLTIPKVLVNTTVAARGTEKTEVPSRALTSGSDTFTAAWFAGAVDIALELVSQSDPSIVALVVENLFQQYAAATDAAATTSLNTSATATGAALSFATYGAFVATIMDTADVIRQATGVPGNLLQLKTASWKSLMSLVDSQGRRILATTNPTNADGSASLTASSVDVGGITVFHNPRTTTDIQFNAVSARIAEKPPLQVSTINVAQMGQDVGILGATIWIPAFTTGIKRHAATELREEEASGKRK